MIDSIAQGAVNMVQTPVSNPQGLADKVHESVIHVEQQTAQLRRQYSRLMVSGTVSSAGATLVAGITAALGPVVGQGISGWRLACIVAAILGFVATLCITISQQLGIGDKLAAATQSLGRLKSLELSITTGSHEWSEVAKEYQDIVLHNPDALK